MTNLLGELDTEVSVGPVAGDTLIHDLIDNVQHIVLQMNTSVQKTKQIKLGKSEMSVPKKQSSQCLH